MCTLKTYEFKIPEESSLKPEQPKKLRSADRRNQAPNQIN